MDFGPQSIKGSEQQTKIIFNKNCKLSQSRTSARRNNVLIKVCYNVICYRIYKWINCIATNKLHGMLIVNCNIVLIELVSYLIQNHFKLTQPFTTIQVKFNCH
jgi:hypothetical protein